MKYEKIKIHLGYLSLVFTVIPLIISYKSRMVVFPDKQGIIFLLSGASSLILAIFIFPRWQSFVSFLLIAYFVYRLMTDPVCMMYA